MEGMQVEGRGRMDFGFYTQHFQVPLLLKGDGGNAMGHKNEKMYAFWYGEANW